MAQQRLQVYGAWAGNCACATFCYIQPVLGVTGDARSFYPESIGGTYLPPQDSLPHV